MTNVTVVVNPPAQVTVTPVPAPSVVTAIVSGPAGASYPTPWVGTQAAYEALSTYDVDRFYIIT